MRSRWRPLPSWAAAISLAPTQKAPAHVQSISAGRVASRPQSPRAHRLQRMAVGPSTFFNIGTFQ